MNGALRGAFFLWGSGCGNIAPSHGRTASMEREPGLERTCRSKSLFGTRTSRLFCALGPNNVGGSLSATVDRDAPDGGRCPSRCPGPGRGFSQPRPSGPPPASQRRAISGVIRWSIDKSVTTLIARAAASFRAGAANPQRCRRGLPGMNIVRGAVRSREFPGAQCYARHAPPHVVFRVLSSQDVGVEEAEMGVDLFR